MASPAPEEIMRTVTQKEKRDLSAIVWYIPHQFVFTALGVVRRWQELRKLCARYWGSGAALARPEAARS